MKEAVLERPNWIDCLCLLPSEIQEIGGKPFTGSRGETQEPREDGYGAYKRDLVPMNLFHNTDVLAAIRC